jgi:hypothetical protein
VDKGVDAAAYSKVLVTEAYDAFASREKDEATMPQAAMARAQVPPLNSKDPIGTKPY